MFSNAARSDNQAQRGSQVRASSESSFIISEMSREKSDSESLSSQKSFNSSVTSEVNSFRSKSNINFLDPTSAGSIQIN